MTQALMAGPSMDQWQVLREQANVLLKSGYLPQHVKTAEQAIAIIMTGQELGVSPTRALNGITVIQGKPTLGAELMAVLIYRDHGPDALLFKETSNERCTIAYRRKGASQGGEYSFTMADAQKAGLAGSQTWQKFPAAMLRARCISAVARFAFPDSIAGCFTPEELGASVQVIGDQVEVLALPEQPRQITNGNGHTTDTVTGEIRPPAPVAAQPLAGPSRDELKALLPALKAEVRLWHPEANVPDASPATLTEARALHAVLKQHLKALPATVTEDQTHAMMALVQRVSDLGGDADMPETTEPRQSWHAAWTAMRAEADRLAELVSESPL